MREKLMPICSRVGFILALIPMAVAALLIWSHTDKSPWGPFLDPLVEYTMEYGWSWTYWAIIVLGVVGAVGAVVSFYLARRFPPRSIWIMKIFTVILAIADVLLFFMIYEAGSTIGFINSIASL